MSLKGAAAPKGEKKITGEKSVFGLRTKPEELPEITHNCWKEWDDILMTLKEYFRLHFQDLESICPDLMMLEEVPAYVEYPEPEIDIAKCAALTEVNDPMGLRKQTMLLQYRTKLSACNQKQEKQMLDRGSAYRVIRSMCSPQLNAILMVDPKFIKVKKTDPLELLTVIKSVVTSRCDGNEELERSQALRDWYTLTMHNGEDLMEYGRRGVKLYDRLTHTGVPKAQLPEPKQQAMRFIDGLNSTISIYYDYKNYLSNSLEVSQNDIYPKTLVEAINSITRFHRGAKIPPALANPNLQSVLGATSEEKAKGKPKGGKAGKNKDEKPKPDQAEKDGREKNKDKKFTGACHNCGKIGHYAKDCRSKKKEPAPAPHTTCAAVMDLGEDSTETNPHDSFYTSFGPMFDNEDGSERNCNMTYRSEEDGTLGTITVRTIRGSNPDKYTEAIFDTGATGTIITCEEVLTGIATCTPTVFKGLHGSLTVTKAGQLGDIGVVHFDPRAGLSIISASDCLLQGHQWEFRQGANIDQDVFLLHTKRFTYRFQHRGGLYVTDLGVEPALRYDDAPLPRAAYAHPAIVKTPGISALYMITKLPTTTANEAQF